MKKTRKSANTKSKKTKLAPVPLENEGRRKALRLLRNGAFATPFIAVAGYFSVQSVQATICEADLSKIGKGTPSIVQIHDPSCQLCTTLQRQSRRALKRFDDSSYEFLVANIKTAEGSTLAAVHNVPHVTLLLFNGDGQMVRVVRGPTDMDTLERVFRTHLNAS